MMQTSTAVTDAARRIWVRNSGDAATPEELAAAAESVFAQLQAGLGAGSEPKATTR